MKKYSAFGIILGLLILPRMVSACASCYGNGVQLDKVSGGDTLNAMNMAMIAMLGIIGAVLLMFIVSFFLIRRNLRRHRPIQPTFSLT